VRRLQSRSRPRRLCSQRLSPNKTTRRPPPNLVENSLASACPATTSRHAQFPSRSCRHLGHPRRHVEIRKTRSGTSCHGMDLFPGRHVMRVALSSVRLFGPIQQRPHCPSASLRFTRRRLVRGPSRAHGALPLPHSRPALSRQTHTHRPISCKLKIGCVGIDQSFSIHFLFARSRFHLLNA
jgi:hypothetical protein